MDDCPSRSELEDFLTDRLPTEGDSRVLTHLESCSACQQILETLTASPVSEAGRTRVDAGPTLPSEGEGNGLYPLPFRIGQYTVIRVLGHGGMGVVYLAEQAALKRLVALKVIRHGINATSAEVARFRAEAEAVARLQHPNIVQIHEVGDSAGVYYLVLEYVEGGSLDRQLAGTPQEPRAAARVIETLARAVHHAHRRGILHRDLKPANVLLDAQGQPKVTDFGMAKNLQGDSGLTASGQILGTPSYIAPEQASGKHGEATSGRRYLRPGGAVIRDAHRPAAVQGGHSPVHARAGGVPGTGDAHPISTPHPTRPGDDLLDVPGEAAEPALRVGRRPGG